MYGRLDRPPPSQDPAHRRPARRRVDGERAPRLAEAREHPADLGRYYREVEAALVDTDAVLVVGPANAKVELVKHARRHARRVATKMMGLETVDHPTDAQLVAYARDYFGFEPLHRAAG